MTTEKKRFTAREATESDLPVIAEFFRRHDYGPKEIDWLRWKFLENPDGAALLYLAEDSDGTVVGFQALMPRRFASETTGIFVPRQMVDVFIASDVRKQGVRGEIGKFAGPRRDYLLIGFPNKLFRKILKPTDKDTIIPMEEWWFPLNIGGLIAEKSYRVLAPLANMLSRVLAFFRLPGRRKNIAMKSVERFERDYEFAPNVIHGVRSADYLNWRFIDNPMRRYSAYEFFDCDESIGYCAYAEIGSVVEIFDLIVRRYPKSCSKLLVDEFRSRGVTHLSFRCAGLPLREFGFLRRGSHGDCIISDPANGSPPYRPTGSWMVTLADSDY